MKKILSMLIACVILINTSFGYTLTLRKGLHILTREGIMAGTNINFGNNYLMDWNVINGEIIPTRIDLQTGNFTMPESDVEIKISNKLLADIAQVGDYVTYASDNTEFIATNTGGSDQTFNPSLCTSWRVFKVEDGIVELIPDSTVGNLTLTGTAAVNGATILNDLAASYINPLFASGSRVFNFGISINSSDTDYTQLSNSGLTINSDVWTSYFAGDETTGYQGYVLNGNSLSMKSLSGVLGTSQKSVEAGVRPVVSLLDSVEGAGGDGSVESPWILGVPDSN